MSTTPRESDPADVLARLEAEAREKARRRDLAADGDERSDAHHHPAEAATDAERRERDLRALLRLRDQEERARRAREAVEAGTYGVCVDCGEAIPEARLKVMPDADRCVACASRAGRGRR
ncbi:MAG: TraR/DksA C4-type zinc finger protein [Thermoleophilia bacterium]|jgi:RNA polymerase-binding transcription factor DksA|nr:TraR/DksA C4-type zinc finger protein [Thermoleophilia bacterium]